MRVLVLSLQGFGEKERSPVHTPNRRHTLWEREIACFGRSEDDTELFIRHFNPPNPLAKNTFKYNAN